VAEIDKSPPGEVKTVGTDDKNALRPFHVDVPEAELIGLRRRINATRWPDRETVTDESQGVQLGTLQELAGYWTTGYDWRKCEAKLNALPQFITNKVDKGGHYAAWNRRNSFQKRFARASNHCANN
jgi:hypothetical protein